MYVDVEVVDTPLDYNILLSHSLFYAMSIFMYLVFYVPFFPHEGNIFMIKQINYCISFTKPNPMDNIVPLIRDNPSNYESVRVGLFENSSLMGVFPLPSHDIPREPWY